MISFIEYNYSQHTLKNLSISSDYHFPYVLTTVWSCWVKWRLVIFRQSMLEHGCARSSKRGMLYCFIVPICIAWGFDALAPIDHLLCGRVTGVGRWNNQHACRVQAELRLLMRLLFRAHNVWIAYSPRRNVWILLTVQYIYIYLWKTKCLIFMKSNFRVHNSKIHISSCILNHRIPGAIYTNIYQL